MIPMLGSFSKMTLIKGIPRAADLVAPHITIETVSALEKLKNEILEIENDIAENNKNKKRVIPKTAANWPNESD